MSSKKPFSFKSSALSVAADQLWSASKKEFKAGDTSVKLDLGKTLGEKSEPAARPAETTKNTGFVFGSKITERVIVDNKVTNEGEKDLSANGDTVEGSKEGDEPKTASAVFESILKKAFLSGQAPSTGGTLENDGASTSVKTKESPDKINGKETSKQPKTSNVVISTGEENEINVHHASCKIYAFDSTQKKFVERGLANLRINRCDDAESSTEHRIVGRVSGNQRVIINSRIFPDMLLEKISPKRLKFSAQTPDSDLPLIFLAVASEFVTEQLYMVLHEIVDKAKVEASSRKRRASDNDDTEDKSAPKRALAESDS
ncbi:unnamed protein product [Enterobius vermicularis]|uniref:RanBD1 domain-containing protein n=1 Tax=Enterobius vermicularis TaxID=51028 RepID=A0A0N4V972_ENTVE|nr:unnamed protein product [Enterobius vermicularis]